MIEITVGGFIFHFEGKTIIPMLFPLPDYGPQNLKFVFVFGF